MRVIVNRFTTLGQRTGIGHYTAELLRCLHEQAPGEIDCFPTGLAWKLSQLWGKARPVLNMEKHSHHSSQPSFLASLKKHSLHTMRTLVQAFLSRQLRKALAGSACDLYHEPNIIPLPCDIPTVTTVPDLSVFLHPEWHPMGRVAFYEKKFVPSLAHSQHFLAISEFTRQEMMQILGVPGERITRVYMGIRAGLQPVPAEQVAATLRRLELPPSYLLYVGTIEPRKNLLMLLRAYCALPAQLRQTCPLLLVGHWGWRSADVADYYQTQARQAGVIHLGYVGDTDLAAVYQGARALVFPSLYEGFGLPPLEMMACGGAVLASTAGAVVEVAGRQAHLIDPHDQGGWTDAMARVIRDHDWHEQLRHGAVETARPFTWDRCAAETLQVYRKLCAQGKSQQAA